MQRINDHKLEFFTYSSVRDIKSKKKERIFSGEGPFKLQFKNIMSNVIFIYYFYFNIIFIVQDESDKFNRIYLNIDGEYINLIKPKEMRIRLSKINNGS